MTHVQVSNARRIGFTALALVAFWVLAIGVYWTCARWYVASGAECWFWVLHRPTNEHHMVLVPDWLSDNLWWVLPSASIVPSLLLSLSIPPIKAGLRDSMVWVFALSCAGTTWVCYWLGERDVMSNMARRVELGTVPEGADRFDSLHVHEVVTQAADEHVVSWPPLLLPIILTTAFVIFGAWRNAGRDAEVEPVGEDE